MNAYTFYSLFSLLSVINVCHFRHCDSGVMQHWLNTKLTCLKQRERESAEERIKHKLFKINE